MHIFLYVSSFPVLFYSYSPQLSDTYVCKYYTTLMSESQDDITLSIFIKTEPMYCDFYTSQIHRLCVFASGSFITDIFICWTFIRVSCLHFGQYKGKFSSIVSSRNFNLVLFPHMGHNNHFSCFMLIPPVVLFPYS